MKLVIALIAALSTGTACADLVVVANPSIKVSSLSRGEVTRIFLGQSDSFPDGSAAIPLDAADNGRSSFYTDILKKSPVQMEKYWARMIFTGKSQVPRQLPANEIRTRVAETKGAISYIDRANVDASVKIISIHE